MVRVGQGEAPIPLFGEDVPASFFGCEAAVGKVTEGRKGQRAQKCKGKKYLTSRCLGCRQSGLLAKVVVYLGRVRNVGSDRVRRGFYQAR